MYKKLKVYQGSQRNDQAVPKILLVGQWLETIGFSIGNRIEVEYTADKIMIAKVTEAESDTVSSAFAVSFHRRGKNFFARDTLRSGAQRELLENKT